MKTTRLALLYGPAAFRKSLGGAPIPRIEQTKEAFGRLQRADLHFLFVIEMASLGAASA